MAKILKVHFAFRDLERLYSNWRASFALTYADAWIAEQCRANCIYDNACLVCDGIKREATVIFVYAILTPVGWSAGQSHFMRTKLHFDVANATRDDTGDNCRISHKQNSFARKSGIHRAENTEWNGIGNLFFNTSPKIQDRAESIKIRRIYDRCVSLVCDDNATVVSPSITYRERMHNWVTRTSQCKWNMCWLGCT